jgi:hypothetical protein
MTPIEEVLFRSSGTGALMVTKQGAGITEVQLKRIGELIYEKSYGINAAGNKVKFEGTPKPEELEKLINKRDAPPELSDTAKAFVKKIWLKNEKGVVKDIKSKYLDKGIFNEEEAITLKSDVDGVFYAKNEERRYNKDHSGECDIVKDLDGKRIIIDVKCSWDAETFMSAKPSTDYEWQGRVYMELWDAEEFYLSFCLVDCPPHIVAKEKEYAWRKYYSDTMGEEEQATLETMMQPIYDQIDRNLVYSNNERFTKEERVKTFKYYRDKSKMDDMAEMVKLAREYYKTITLNGNN